MLSDTIYFWPLPKVSLNFLEKGTGALTFSTIEQAQSFFNSLSPLVVSVTADSPPPPPEPKLAPSKPKAEQPQSPTQSPTLPVFKKKGPASPAAALASPAAAFDISSPQKSTIDQKKSLKVPFTPPKEIPQVL